MNASWRHGKGDPPKPPVFDREVQEFLRVEADHLGDSLIANEEAGERRINVFFGVLGAALAGLGLAANALSDELQTVAWLAVGVTLLMFAFGLGTARRVMERNLATTDFLNALWVLRVTQIARNPAIAEFLPLVPSRQPRPREKKDWLLGKAGFLETVALANSLIAALGAALAVFLLGLPFPGPFSVGIAVLAFAWIGQIAWARSVYAAHTAHGRSQEAAAIKSWASLDRGETFRAGVGMLVAAADGKLLALERSDVRGAWQLPQGGLELGEDLETAAWRELQEEVALTRQEVDLVDRHLPWLGYELPVEHRSHKTGRGQVHAWFLFRLKPHAKLPPLPSSREAEFRDRRWLTPEELLDRAAVFRAAQYADVIRWYQSQ
jgi:putative (di)nucleoside polyphosphate hydrolase